MEKRKLTEADMRIMNLPRLFWDVQWKDVHDPTGVIQKYLTNREKVIQEGVGLFMSGPAGSGCTTAISFMCKIFRAYGYSVQYISSSDLQRKIWDGKEFDTGTSWSTRIKEVDILAIDDFGRETSKGSGVHPALDIVNHRIDWKKPTIFCLRQDKEVFSNLYGEAQLQKMLYHMQVAMYEKSFYLGN